MIATPRLRRLALAGAVALTVIVLLVFLVVGGSTDREEADPDRSTSVPTTGAVDGPGAASVTTTSEIRRAEAVPGGPGRALDVGAIPDAGAYAQVSQVLDLAEIPGTADVLAVSQPDAQPVGVFEGRIVRLAREGSALVPRWSTDLPSGAGSVYAGSEAAYVVAPSATGTLVSAVDLRDGRVRWSTSLGRDLQPCLGCGSIVGSDFVYSGIDGAVVRAGPDSPEPLWEHRPGAGLSQARVAGDVVVASQEGLEGGTARLEVIDLATGRLRSEVPLSCGDAAQPAGEALLFEVQPIDGSDDVFVTWSRERRCAARLSPDDGALRWSIDLGSVEGDVAPVYAEGRVALAADGRVSVVDLASGESRVMAAVPADYLVPRWLGDDVAAEVINSGEHLLVRWDAESGEVVAEAPLSFSPMTRGTEDLASAPTTSAQNPGLAVADGERALSISVLPDGPLVTTDLGADPPVAPVVRADLPVIGSSFPFVASRGGGDRVWVAWAGSVVGFTLSDDEAATWTVAG